jgi:predicted AlkP superfamily phosphohydrolase/phosphomutase/tetratricopeptide (TPR) repeat protein
MPQRLAKRILFIGWDAADWDFINPLMEAGHMPNLKRLSENGVIGKISTLTPMLSPMLWNSIATGKRADKHGILGFVEPDGQGFCRPVSSTSRKSKALWNILSQNGLRSCVIGWFASHPAEKIKGVVFSDRYEQTSGQKADKFPLDEQSIHPASMLELAKDLQVRPDELSDEQVLPFIPQGLEIDQDTDKRPAACGKTLAECATLHNAATYMVENEQWDLLAVYYDTIDHMGHGFMEYNPPKMDHVSDRDFELYKHVMTGTYRFHDMMLGRLMELAGPDTTLVLLSDHGFHHAESRPKYFKHPEDPEKRIGPALDPLAWHRPYGVFVASGPGVKKDELVHGATLLDVCPTILTLLGLPVAKDMDGHVLTTIFQSPPQVEYIDTYEGEHPDDGVWRGDYAEDPYAAQAALQHLIDLGYVANLGDDQQQMLKQVECERKSVLAQVLYASGKYDQAETLLRETLVFGPTPGLVARLAMVLMDQRKFAEAEAVLEKYSKTISENVPLLWTVRGQIKFMQTDYDGAFELFQKVLEADPKSPNVHVLLGQIHLQKKRWAMAEEAFRRVLEREPDHAEAHDGLGVALSGQKKLEDALFHHMQSAALKHDRWLTHYNLGLVLLEMNQVDWGIRAIETASELAPHLPMPHRVLAQVYRNRKQDVGASMQHFKMAAEKYHELERRRQAAEASQSPEAIEAAVTSLPPDVK